MSKGKKKCWLLKGYVDSPYTSHYILEQFNLKQQAFIGHLLYCTSGTVLSITGKED